MLLLDFANKDLFNFRCSVSKEITLEFMLNSYLVKAVLYHKMGGRDLWRRGALNGIWVHCEKWGYSSSWTGYVS